jgi:hypothetical protein
MGSGGGGNNILLMDVLIIKSGKGREVGGERWVVVYKCVCL